MYPPQTLAKMEAYGETVRHVLAASGAKVVVTNDGLEPLIRDHLLADDGATGRDERALRPEPRLADKSPTKLVLEKDTRGAPGSEHEALPVVELEDLAFLQFTSGSTSKPKGVMVTHRNLSVNSHAIMFDGLRSTPADKGVSWLPLYHDMGLIGFVIAPLYALVQVMFLPTMAFIRRPSLWLEAIHRFRGTITFAPNFAYALATRAVTETQAQHWDLSCMRALGCGAEPIQADVMRSFLARFQKNGLRPESALPSYGMAEATLAVTFWDVTKEIVTDKVDLHSMKHGKADAPKGGPSMELVCCGQAFPDHEVKIMSAAGPLGHRQVGEIWLRGPSVTAGYFGNAEATEETFCGGWLKTGDLGYTTPDGLYICGRAKDLIILNGKNYYPQDIEAVVSRVDGIRDGQCVAFSKLDATGAEIAVVVAEARRASRELCDKIVQAVRSELGLTIGEVHFIRRTTLPKTSSGKVRRRDAKARLERGELELLTESAAEHAAEQSAAI
jgi:fatty-acyl-CoA synthase